MLQPEESSSSSSNNDHPGSPTSDISTDHVAVLVLCEHADEVYLRTIQECARHFESQVYVVGYDACEEEGMAATLQKHESGNVHYSYHPTKDKLKALRQGCEQLSPKTYSHVLLIDAQVGARTALLEDGLSQKTNIPTCDYFVRVQPETSTAKESTSSRRRGFRRRSSAFSTAVSAVSSPSATYASSRSKRLRCKPSRRLSCPSTFDEETDENKPNHFLDLWERTTLLSYLNMRISSNRRSSKTFVALHDAVAVQSTFCSLRHAIFQSTLTTKYDSFTSVIRSSSLGEDDGAVKEVPPPLQIHKDHNHS